MNIDPLFEPLELGALTIPNRIVMAPLTRMRAGEGNAPTMLNAEYYAQRASAGLIIAEGTAVSPNGQGYPNAPGIYTREQMEGWKRVTDGVHRSGGRIFLQIAHNGRNSHSSLLPFNNLPVAPSEIPSNLPALTRTFQQVPIETPRALRTEEVSAVVQTFGVAALNAMEAGFDGVEIQAANSHLIDQFLEDGTNRRRDRYGGAIENRMRFLCEIVDEVGGKIGTNRIGVRLSPFGHYGGIRDSNPLRLFTSVVEQLNNYKLAYLHLIEGRGSEIGLGEELNHEALNNAKLFRPHFKGVLITAAAYSPLGARTAIVDREADAVAFGRSYIANPDLVERIRFNLPLNAYDRATFYGGDATGYVDYPTHGESSDQDSRAL